MWKKIKNLFGFIGRAWTGGPRGKLGIVFALFAVFIFIRMFIGYTNIQRFVMNIWYLNNERVELESQTAKLNELRLHLQLLRDYSPDYIEELGLQYLNIGDAKYKILKI
ncbi:MAG: hypothetical protein IJ866_00940 [Alphaproteobacteria bacterium]|nr:hypothetical protein [Alphaproteobacteria bacterium]